MGILDDIIQIEKNGAVIYNQWIEWVHFGVPNKPKWLRGIIRCLLAILGHCMVCSAMDGCFLVTNKMPTLPQHIRCDCKKKDISFYKVKMSANAECDIRKFTEYIFNKTKQANGKKEIFIKMGYNIKDSIFLQQEFCNQALHNYLIGNYNLKNLDTHGLRLAIPICLKDKKFLSGWLLYPEGEIKNTTPFGGWSQ